MQPFGSLLLISRVLGGEPEQIRYPQSLQLREVIAERTALRCTAARARYHVPSRRVLDPRFARARIGVNDSPSGKGREIDHASVRGSKRDRGEVLRQPNVALRHRPTARVLRTSQECLWNSSASLVKTRLRSISCRAGLVGGNMIWF